MLELIIMPIVFGILAAVVLGSLGYQTIIAPRRWMKQYGDGIYNPLRHAYKKAGEENERISRKV